MLRIAAAILSLAFAACVPAAEPSSAQVLFVCEHGTVKSAMAASYFNEVAHARGLPFSAVSRASAPNPEGAARVSSQDVAASARVITIGTSLPTSVDLKDKSVEQWNDVPAASVDYAAARATLHKRVEALIDRMTQANAPLSVETKIALPGVKGRIDHLALDVAQQRLFVAALGNGTVEVVDLKSRQRVRSVTGFDEPQGVAVLPRSQTLLVASGGDGSLRTVPLNSLTVGRTIDLGDDADNVRIDGEQRFAYVGYGNGALAVIDGSNQTKVADIRLKGHPESFQLEPSGRRIFVNVPEANEIAVIDRDARKQIASWPTGDLRANFAMALDERNQRLLVSFRRPALLAAFNLSDGKELTRIETCGDADDVFVDSRRAHVYVACGDGFVDIFADHDGGYSRIGHLPTSAGARTALYSAELDRLFVAARANGSEPAAIWIIQPTQ